ncbi:MAG: hypothetical protein GDA39_03700 [Hyphomonadaceae bacterium]|nr:hypothetical protein [Hyphomonadaceae bacterium]
METGRFKLRFLPNEADEGEGLNHPGLEHYLSHPYAGMARETGQNSLDARNSDEDPVVMVFEKKMIKAGAIPDLDELSRVTDICLRQAKDKKEVSFFEDAKRILGNEQIPVLVISDHNTTGADGEQFHALTKSTGISEKGEADSGGSFGIGKFAAFAVSDLRTVFYATCFEENGTEKQLYHGKTLYRSFEDPDATEHNSRRATGYWGNSSDYSPIDSPGNVPAWMLRDNTGTTVFCLGMRERSEQWAFETFTVLLRNFFAAIHEKKLVFKISNNDGNVHEISSDNLKENLDSKAVSDTAADLQIGEQLESARALYRCLTDPDAKQEQIEIGEAGKFTFRILLRDNIGYHFGFIRNGIFITDNLRAFGQSFSRFPMYSDFACLVWPSDAATGAIVKTLENPRHDELTAERITDPIEAQKRKVAFKKLASRIRDLLKENARQDPEDRVDLDELNEFFASELEQGDDEGDDESLTKVVITKVETKKPTPDRKTDPEGPDTGGESGAADERGIHGGPGPGHGDNDGDGTGRPGDDSGDTVMGFRKTYVTDTRVVQDKTSSKYRIIHFTPVDTGTVRLKVRSQGITNNDVIRIRKAGSLRRFANKIQTRVTTADRQSVAVELEIDFRGALLCDFEIRPGDPA